MDTIDLDFITTASGEDGRYHINGIPHKLWEMFTEAAKKAMPEKGDLAWASLLTEIIQKHVIGDVYTYIMTDIPQAARDAFVQAAAQADLSLDHVIGVMFKQAMEGKLHILNMITPEGTEKGYRVLLIAGLSDPAWKEWTRVSHAADMHPEELIGMMFEAAAGGTLELTQAPADPHKYQFEGRESHAPRQQQSGDN